MKHLGTKYLETNRLILRKNVIEDAKMMFENWASDSEVTKYLTWPTHTSVDITKMILNSWIEEYSKDNFYQWGIVLKETNELIGSISVVNINEEANSIEIGYCISRKHWNKGITTEALNRLINFFFEEAGVKKIYARHDQDNVASGKVMIKCGMKFVYTKEDRNNTNEKGICKYYEIEK